MSEIKPKKERRFLKTLGRVGEILVEQVLIKLGSSIIKKIGGKKTLPSILFLFLSLSLFAQFPNTGNKQRLGFQTTADGLVWRGSIFDTASIQPINNQNAWVILDTINLKFYTFDFTSNVWNLVGGALTMPFDSITFNTAKNGTVGVGEVEYNDTQGSLIQGLKGGNVTNVIGQQLHQRVNNRTGAPLAKGDVVYLSGSQGNRITVAKGLAVSDAFSANTFGVVAESIADNQSGFIITEGLITGLNTSALTEDSAVYLSPTVPGALTSTKPQAPQHSVYIGVCVKSNNGSGELFVKIRNGQELDELHDVRITSPVDRASLYYKLNEKLWRDTTAALLVSDTAAMLANYSLKGYVDSIAQNFQDSIDEITNGYFKQEFISVTKDTLNWTKPVQLPIGGSNLLLVYRNGQMINDAQYSVIDTNKVKINSGSYKLGENYTVVYVKGGGGSGSGGVPFDTSVLNLQARLDLKLNISDTAAMLANYATKSYADTTGRFYARQDFSNVSSSTLTWTQSDTLVTGGVNVVQVYRNGQILLPSQYTIPTSTSVVISATSYKAGENYTVIFPRGGGAGGEGGSGSLTSISAGTGITVSPNPITTTGTVSADLSILMELSDTSLLNLTSRFNTKLNISDTASMLSNYNTRINSKLNISDTASMLTPYFRDADTTSLNLTSRFATKLNISDTATMLSNYNTRINSKLNISDTLSMLAPYFRDADTTLLNLTSRFATKLNLTDTASLSNRINAKGTGTVQNIATGYGITGGAITTTGTLLLDSAVVFSRIRDSIVDVAIGNDTIKILKQEYAPATTSVLTWTITPKFPIQSKAYILVFRNGQLLINDQYNLTDTNKITIVSNSFKVGANYTVVTVSGIGSVGTGVFPNPVYPEAGIAVSTGSAWASSIANNSSNWNVAFNDKITNAQFTGTNTKTLTLTQYDGGTFTPTFADLQGVTGVTAGTGLTGGTITTTGTVAVDFTTVAPLASPTFTGTVSGITKSMVGLGNVDNTSDANKPVSTATQTALNLKVNISDTASMLTPYFRDADTSLLNLTSRFAAKLNISDTASMLTPYFRDADTTSLNLTSRFATKLNYTDTSFLFTQSDTSQLNLTSRFAAKQNTLSGNGFVKANGTNISYDNSSYLRTGLADSTYLKLTGGTLTGALNGTTGTFTGLNVNNTNVNGEGVLTIKSADFNTASRIQFGDGPEIRKQINYASAFSNLDFRTLAVGGGEGGYSFYTRRNPNAEILSFVIDRDGNSNFYGTLGVTGAATLGSTLAVSGDITENGNNVLTSADTTSMLLPYLRTADTTNMLSPYFRDADTSLLNLTSRFNTKQNTLSGNGFVKANGTNITYDNSTYLTTGTAAATYQTILTNPVTGTGTTNTLPLFTGSSTLGNSVVQQSSNNIGINTTPFASLTLGQGKNIMLDASSNNIPRILFYESNARNENDVQFGAKIQYNSPSDRLEFIMRDSFAADPSGDELAISITRQTGNTTIHKDLTVTGNITEAGNNVLTSADTTSMLLPYLRKADTVSLSSRINGKVSLNGDETINGSKSFNNVVNVLNRMTISGSVEGGNQLLGKNSSNNYVSDITLGTGLSITGNVLNVAIPTERYYFDLGIVAGAADNSASTYDYTYGSNIFIVPTSLNGYCIDSVYIRAIGCSTCPPVSPDLDYYVGVYKANAGSRVATSGATLVGSQITMNEYDLNEVNRNDTLSTGEAWWVYLNGTYTSDMAYVTAGFVVKKTCN